MKRELLLPDMVSYRLQYLLFTSVVQHFGLMFFFNIPESFWARDSINFLLYFLFINLQQICMYSLGIDGKPTKFILVSKFGFWIFLAATRPLV